MIAAIAALALTVATNPSMSPGFAVDEADYPPFAMRYNHEGVVGFTVGVDAGGVPHDCAVLASSTFAELDARTCEIVIGRMRFTPAHDKRGRAVAGTYRNRVRWQIAPGQPAAFIDGLSTTDIIFTPDGRIESCKVNARGIPEKAVRFGCDEPAKLSVLLGAPLTDLVAARVVHLVRPGVDTVPPPDGLPNGIPRMSLSFHIAVAPDGKIASCTPITAVMGQRAMPDPCLSFPIGTPTYAADPTGTERHGVLGMYISIQRRPGRP